MLLDQARAKVIHLGGFTSWEDLHAHRSFHQLLEAIDEILVGQLHRPSWDAVDFLCQYNNVREDGNTTAHSMSQDEIREALITKPLTQE